MYLKELTLNNFRKFRDNNNSISFVRGFDIYDKEIDEDLEEADSSTEKITEVEIEETDGYEYNFAENITLIVGKNNSGKTTVIRALEKISNEKNINSSDFNYVYLNNVLNNILKIDIADDVQDLENRTDIFPELSISLKIAFDHNKDDLLSNIYPVLEMSDFKNGDIEIDIEIKWIIKEQEKFLKNFLQSIDQHKSFTDFCKLLDETEYEIKYFRSDKEIKKFNIKKLLNLHVINATKVREPENSLSKAFNKILFYRFKNVLNNEDIDRLGGEIEESEKEFIEELEGNIIDFNKGLSEDLEKNINVSLNDALEEVVSDDIFEIILTSDLDIDKLLRNIIQYSYSEGGYFTAENNFGLGYSNLVMVIAEIIDYISRYQKSDSPESTINLIAIEEPEVHMHPQMQENFILNVEKMVNSLLLSFNKEISTQIIITTHSPHILNSKIHSGNSFNNINYINSENGFAKAVALDDDSILSNSKDLQTNESDSSEIEEKIEEEEIIKSQSQLTFLKKHIKFQISEIFFSDAVIFVEGATESTLVPYYLEKEPYLSKKFITLAMVDGAHAHMYFPLLKLLEIPSLIITDMDIKREPHEKNIKNKENPDDREVEYTQVVETNINARKTTNNILRKVCGDDIKNIINKGLISVENNIVIATQNMYVNEYLPTSFEEAYILENVQNNNLRNALEQTKPQLFTDWVDENQILTEKSFEIQMKLDGSKVEFPSNILLSSVEEDDFNLPKLPTYIEEGFKWLSNQLRGEQDE